MSSPPNPSSPLHTSGGFMEADAEPLGMTAAADSMPTRDPGALTQERVNTETWGSGGFVRHYLRRGLRPPERILFDRHSDALSGRVLEIGCGGGRMTRELLRHARAVHGIDIGADMVARCRRTYPSATFAEQDLRDLSSFADGSWEAIVAGFNVIDVVDDRDRGVLLDELHRLLSPDGVVIFSSHNLACASLIASPMRNVICVNPVRSVNRLLRLPRSLRNRRRLGLLQHVDDADHGILNDMAHDYSLLHYYITRDGQQRQLELHGFELLDCVDLTGAPVDEGMSALGCHELHYAARAIPR